jgi:hypothetical protein
VSTYIAQLLGLTIVWFLCGVLFYFIAKLFHIPKGVWSFVVSAILNFIILISPVWNNDKLPESQSIISYCVAYSIIFFIYIVSGVLKSKDSTNDVIYTKIQGSENKTQNSKLKTKD